MQILHRPFNLKNVCCAIHCLKGDLSIDTNFKPPSILLDCLLIKHHKILTLHMLIYAMSILCTCSYTQFQYFAHAYICNINNLHMLIYAMSILCTCSYMQFQYFAHAQICTLCMLIYMCNFFKCHECLGAFVTQFETTL